MSFLSDLLDQLAGLPAEDQPAAIEAALNDTAELNTGELSAEVLDRYSTLSGTGTPATDADLDAIEMLARVADGIQAFNNRLADRANRAAAAAAALSGLNPADEPEPEEPAAAADPEPEPEAEEPQEFADSNGSNGSCAGGCSETPAEPAEPATESTPAAVPAADAPAGETAAAMANNGNKIQLGDIPSSPAPVARQGMPGFEKFNLIAAADVPGFAVGQQLDGLGDLAVAWEHRMMPLITGSINSGRDGDRTRVGIARIKRSVADEFTIRDDNEAEEKIRNACDESKLPGGSLVAAAGWCAPSETLYDLCPIRITQEGIISLPTVIANRGGIRYAPDFDWTAVWSSIGFQLTEAEVIAGTEKPCIEVPCPTEFNECRMDVAGLCIRTPILMERGWPERVEQFIQGALLIHAHKMNARKIAKIEALSTAITIPAPPNPNPAASITDPHGPGAIESLLSVIELEVQYVRYRDRLSQTATLEMIAPFWLRGILKSDLRKKLGIDNRWSVSDATLDTYLRNVGVNPQWVYDWQDSLATGNSGDFGGATPPTAWPSQVKVIIYQAGTFFQLAADVINLDGVYDHASLIQNVYTGLFTEEGWQVCNRCGKSYVITINLCPNGLSGGYQLTQCSA